MKGIESQNLFSKDTMNHIFPEDRTDKFFDALYGDAEEGAYDISFNFKELKHHKLMFEFQLTQRSGKCLVCNLTYGLPEVFSRHPIINIKEIIQKIDTKLPDGIRCIEWTIGNTVEVSSTLHVIPVTILISE